jgi:hypothetical protein
MSSGAALAAAVGTYPITVGAAVGTGLSNYLITYVNGTLTVTAAAPTGYTTYTQGGWGSSPSGNNPGSLLAAQFATLYGSAGYAQVGGNKWLKFASASKIKNFLPAGGTAAVLTANATNPNSSSAGVFAGQVLALRLNVDFSNAGVTKAGLASLKVKSGKLANYTVSQVLVLANAVLGGNTGALPTGVTIADVNAVVDAINNNFDGGSTNNGYLK